MACRSLTSSYYNDLGLNRNCKNEEVRKAFKQLALKHHPDKGGDSEKFQRINKAVEVLCDAKTRLAYDSLLSKTGSLDGLRRSSEPYSYKPVLKSNSNAPKLDIKQGETYKFCGRFNSSQPYISQPHMAKKIKELKRKYKNDVSYEYNSKCSQLKEKVTKSDSQASKAEDKHNVKTSHRPKDTSSTQSDLNYLKEKVVTTNIDSSKDMHKRTELCSDSKGNYNNDDLNKKHENNCPDTLQGSLTIKRDIQSFLISKFDITEPTCVTRPFHLKMVVVGSLKQGTTMFFKRYSVEDLGNINNSYTTRKGIEIINKSLKINSKHIYLQIIVASDKQAQNYIINNSQRIPIDGMILIYDVTDKEAFINLSSFCSEMENKNVYHKKASRTWCGETPQVETSETEQNSTSRLNLVGVLLADSISNQRLLRKVSRNKGVDLAKRYNLKYIEYVNHEDILKSINSLIEDICHEMEV